jgi:catechol 2,3-dioxygenase-like lactoylglutathione lyase family enzyme
MVVELDHVVLEVRDVAGAVKFYGDLLGFPPVRLPEFLAGEAPFASVRINGETLIDFFPPPLWENPESPANPNHICFTLSEVEVAALKKKLVAMGLAIERRLEASFGARGMGRSLYFRDGEGITLEVRHYGAPARE